MSGLAGAICCQYGAASDPRPCPVHGRTAADATAEAREQIARALRAGEPWPGAPSPEAVADRLLAVPAVAEAFAAVEAVEELEQELLTVARLCDQIEARANAAAPLMADLTTNQRTLDRLEGITEAYRDVAKELRAVLRVEESR